MLRQHVEEQNLTGRLRAVIEPSINALGYQLVQLRLIDGKRRKRLEIMAERLDGQFMSFDDCAQISRGVSALLDVDDPIAGAYDLEVSSPGIDRPLATPADYERYKGYEAKIETVLPLSEGRKRFRGKVAPKGKDAVTIATTEGLVEIAFSNIRSAKLVVTDELINEHLRQAEGKAPVTKPHKPNQRKQPRKH